MTITKIIITRHNLIDSTTLHNEWFGYHAYFTELNLIFSPLLGAKLADVWKNKSIPLYLSSNNPSIERCCNPSDTMKQNDEGGGYFATLKIVNYEIRWTSQYYANKRIRSRYIAYFILCERNHLATTKSGILEPRAYDYSSVSVMAWCHLKMKAILRVLLNHCTTATTVLLVVLNMEFTWEKCLKVGEANDIIAPWHIQRFTYLHLTQGATKNWLFGCSLKFEDNKWRIRAERHQKLCEIHDLKSWPNIGIEVFEHF